MIKDEKLDMGFIEIQCNDNELIKEVLGEDELIVVSCDDALCDEVYLDELYSKKWIRYKRCIYGIYGF